MCEHDDYALGLQDFKRAWYQDKVWLALNIIGIRSAIGVTTPLEFCELRVFSQNGEDGVLLTLLEAIKTADAFFVEIGAGDGNSNICRILADGLGWGGVFYEADPESFAQLETRYSNHNMVRCRKAFVTPRNVREILRREGVPPEFGVLSIDIDGQDFWVWQAILGEYRPSVVVIEYNSALTGQVVEAPGASGALTRNWGSSREALVELGRRSGYILVYAETSGVNLFFVRSDLHRSLPEALTSTRTRSPNYGLRGRGHDSDVLMPNGPIADRTLVDPWQS